MTKEYTRGELIASTIKAYPEMTEAEIAKMIDNHILSVSKDMLTLCEAISHLASGWDEEGALGPREPLSWETVGRMAMDYARFAIKRAHGLPPDATAEQVRQVCSGNGIWEGLKRGAE